MSGVASVFSTAACSAETTAGGVPAGAAMPW